MAKKPTSRTTRSSKATAGEEAAPTVALIADDQHPDHVGGLVSDPAALTPLPDGPLPPRPQPFPMPPSPVPIPMPFPGPFPEPFPEPRPLPLPTPIPWPLPLNICMAVSGRYRRTQPVLQPIPTPFPPLGRQPLTPLNLVTTRVRVDVDRFFPQRRISIEVNRIFPQATAHAIAEVTSDVCLGFNNRRVTAMITFRDGLAALIPGTTVVFEASRTTGINYDTYRLTLSGGGISPVVFPLDFESQYFDPVEFEVDRVANAGTAVTTYDTGSHPNRPAGLAAETISLATVYQRAGFDVTMSPNTSVIPTTGAGANGTWSDGEMHNAMVTFWSRFANLPQWAMWVLYAARHDIGRSLGGIMFDDIGANHRQGTAIFTDSFIQDVPAGDANPAAWRQRMVFWTAVHEMGHGFNLAHAWQKSLGTPWIPLADEPEARSFMNYPFRVAGGQAAFFSDFRFRFSDDELIFLRHAPRRFVQMGNANWFVDHGFEGPPDAPQPTGWELEIRPNREVNEYAFLEPVNLELKLTNTSGASRHIEEDLLTDGRHIAVLIGRDGGLTRRWNPLITRCHEQHDRELAPGASIYGAHLVSASTSGWLIDEPGFYRLQAAVDVDGAIVVSNVLRIFVSPPATREESRLAPDYFTEEVGRAIAFDGAPELAAATDTLREVTERAPASRAARHAAVAVSTAMLRDYKRLDTGGGRDDMAIRSTDAKVEEAARVQMDALVKAPEAAAETIGHICYFSDLDRLAGALEQAGDEKEAAKVLRVSVATMKKRGVLGTVIAETQAKLSALA